jgi:hypothetical protein
MHAHHARAQRIGKALSAGRELGSDDLTAVLAAMRALLVEGVPVLTSPGAAGAPLLAETSGRPQRRRS